MIQQEHFTRGGKAYTANFGINQQGQALIYIDAEEPDYATGQPVRYVPVRLEIVFNSMGECQPIVTSWRKILLGNNGGVLDDSAKAEGMKASQPDMVEFTAKLGVLMIPSILNGKIRAIDGFDTQPLFDENGSRIPDENYDTLLEATYTYGQVKEQAVDMDSINII